MEIKIERENGKIQKVSYVDENPRARTKVKPVKKSYLNALIKAQQTPIWWEYKGTEKITIKNAFSGVPVELEPFEASIANWCLAWYSAYSRGKLFVPVATFDAMKYFLLFLNRRAYNDLLD